MSVLTIYQHKILKRICVMPLAICAIFSISVSATAQDSSTRKVGTHEGLNFNLGSTINPEYSSEFQMQEGLIDLPSESVGSTLFKLDISDPKCLTGSGNCLRRNENVNLGMTRQFTSGVTKGLDLSLTPRASMRFNDEESSALVGAVVEIGKDLREGSEFENNTWYVFAGADAEALTYSPNSIGRLTNGQFHLQDRIIVGDAQAGVGYRIGDADVSLSYMRREATAEDFSFSEDAAALSFTWKR
jgi:hypothetical protein